VLVIEEVDSVCDDELLVTDDDEELSLIEELVSSTHVLEVLISCPPDTASIMVITAGLITSVKFATPVILGMITAGITAPSGLV
jgi:hypothetical protein